jgi:hypothetical protein
MKDDELREFDGLGLDEIVAAPSHMKQRWHDSIDLAAQRECAKEQQRPFHSLSFFWGAAVTAALATGIAIGIFVAADSDNIEPSGYVVRDGGADRHGAFNRVLQVHLRDTQEFLSAMPVAADADNRALVLQIIQQNRLFETAAERNNAESLARVLRAFEPILLQLAATDIAPEDADALRRQLAFELRIMLTKLERDSSKETTST